jgi:succinoglycan biosynthesis protein ExoV
VAGVAADGSQTLTLELHYYRGRRPNFGDDLNPPLWREVLPDGVWEAPDAVLVGIGSILTGPGLGHLVSAGKRVVVLGTGTSYGGAPAQLGDWHVLAVRGPLTASVIGRPEAAATDGAYLVVDAPGIVGAPQRRDETLFIPHHRTLRDRPWAHAAAEAGMTFVSPEWSVEQVFDHFARAQLVVTEAMHGAIIADALRIPWVPVQVSPALDEFKWRDWLGSVELPFEPLSVPPIDPRDVRRFRRTNRELERRGFAGLNNVEGLTSSESLNSWLDRRYSAETVAAVGNTEITSLFNRGLGALSLLNRSKALANTVKALRDAAAHRPSLSRDVVHDQRLDQLRSAVARAADIIQAA